MKVQDGHKPVWKGRQYHNSYGQVPERKSTGCFLIVQTWCREYLFSSLVFIISIQECTQFYDRAFLHMNALPVRTANSHSSEHIRAGPTIGPELNHDHGRLSGNLRIEACCLLQLSDANLHKSHPAQHVIITCSHSGAMNFQRITWIGIQLFPVCIQCLSESCLCLVPVGRVRNIRLSAAFGNLYAFGCTYLRPYGEKIHIVNCQPIRHSPITDIVPFTKINET